MKQKLIKQFENGTDFSVCVIAMENGTYVVTEYDFVNKKHVLKGKYNDKNQALMAGKEINKSFMEPSKQTLKLNESQLRQIIKESLKELDWKTYKNAANKRLAQGKYATANELSDMAKNRFDDEFNDNYRYDTLGAKLAGKHSKTFDSTFTPSDEPRLKGRNEKGEELFRNNGRYYNSKRGLTTPEKFFKDKKISDAFNTATQELDNYNNGNYEYTQDKGWHLKESRLNKIIKESIKKVMKEGLDDGYVLHAYIPGLGNKVLLVKSLDDAKKYIGNAEYWDITKGSNSSDPSNLIAWGGEGGYWYNVVNKPAWATGGTWKKLPDSQIQYILSKKQN